MGSSKDGGALYILGSEIYNNINIIQCTFSRNAVVDLSRQSSARGGALHIISVTDSVKIVESVFTNNQVNSTTAKGGALHSSKASLNISACIFENNEAIGTSSGDDSKTFGGALYAEMTALTINNSTFINNKAKGTTSYSHGGAVYASKVNLIFNESLCIGNQANSIGYGGALYASETNSIISKSVFNSNQANGSYSHRGALYSTFYSSLSPGKIITTVIKESTFTNNHANYLGGAVYIRDTLNPVITECNFSNNQLLQSFAQGGAIYVAYSVNLTTVNCSFHSNLVAEHYGKGGALYTQSMYTHLEGCTFFSNGADNDGGTVYVKIDDPYGTISAYQCNFHKNTGGAIYGVNTRKVSVHLSNFTNNLNSTRAVLHVFIVSQNITLIQGLESAVLINQSHFVGNSRAMYSKGIKQIHIENSNFTANIGNSEIVEILGNGLLDNIVLVSSSTFDSNNGTIYCDNISSFSIDHSTFIGNTGDSTSDGVIYVSGSHTNISISHSVFQQNSASFCGVVSIHSLEYGDLSMHNSQHVISLFLNTFMWNIAASSGSVGCFRNASVTISNNIFSHNVASYDGGVFLINNSIVTVSESSFTNNTADYGGVARIFNSLVVHTESTFKQNVASSSGGVFSAQMSNITIRNSMLYNNRADKNGSIVNVYHNPLKHMALCILQILRSNLSDNSALNGGIIYGHNGAIEIAIQNSHFGLNNLTGRGTFATVENMAFSIARKDNDGIQGDDIFACNSVITGQNNSIIVAESTACCKRYILADIDEEGIMNRITLAATCTAENDVTEAVNSTRGGDVTETATSMTREDATKTVTVTTKRRDLTETVTSTNREDATEIVTTTRREDVTRSVTSTTREDGTVTSTSAIESVTIESDSRVTTIALSTSTDTTLNATESDNGATIVALLSIFSILTILIALLTVVVVLVTIVNRKRKRRSDSRSTSGGDVLQGEL